MSFWVRHKHVWLRRIVNTFGVVLIFFSGFYFFALIKGAYAYTKEWLYLPPMLLVKMVSTVSGARVYGNAYLLIGVDYMGPPIAAVLSAMFLSLGFLFGGIGLLRRRQWAKHLFLVLGLDVLAGVCVFVWLLGPQHLTVFRYGFEIAWAAVFLLFFADRDIRDMFATGVKNVGRLAKWLLGIYVVVVALKFLSAPLFIGYMHFGQRELTSRLRAKPKKVAYQVTDSAYVNNACTPYRIYGYSVHLPEDLRVLTVFQSRKPCSWDVMLGRCNGEEYKTVAFLRDRSNQSVMFDVVGKVYRLRSPYELERRINYPGWSPVWMGWKLLGSSIDGQRRVEEVSAPYWKGFVTDASCDSGRKGYLSCSAYDSIGQSSAGVTLYLDGEEMTVNQAKHILATLQFESDDRDAAEYFNQGIVSLSNQSYTDATLDFLNALCVDDANPQYAYYLGRSLYEDECEATRKGRLGTAERFLQYALELDSTYAPAQELLATVEKQVEELEAMKPD